MDLNAPGVDIKQLGLFELETFWIARGAGQKLV
jgi:hypothetical protein